MHVVREITRSIFFFFFSNAKVVSFARSYAYVITIAAIKRLKYIEVIIIYDSTHYLFI